jgi:hypothetical protein
MNNLTDKELNDLAWAGAEIRAEQKARALVPSRNKPILKRFTWLGVAFAVFFLAMCGVCSSFLARPVQQELKNSVNNARVILAPNRKPAPLSHPEISLF